MNRREFMNKSGIVAVARTGVSSSGDLNAGASENNQAPVPNHPSPELAPYPHMWTSDDRGPYIE